MDGLGGAAAYQHDDNGNASRPAPGDDGPRAPLLADSPPLLGVSSKGYDDEVASVTLTLQQQRKVILEPAPGSDEEGPPPVVKGTSWPPSWARAMY